MAIVLLDSNVLGLITNPHMSSVVTNCLDWESDLKGNGNTIAASALIVYEVSRELKRAGKSIGLARLEADVGSILYLPVTQEILDTASDVWAQLRKQGMPTAHKDALDFDVILAAHAIILNATGDRTLVASTNLKHLSRMTETYDWNNLFWKFFS